MKTQDVLPVVISVLVIITIAVVEKQSKTIAALTAVMPVTAPLALWIVYSSSGGEQTAMSEFASGLIARLDSHLRVCHRRLAGYPRWDEAWACTIGRLWRLGHRDLTHHVFTEPAGVNVKARFQALIETAQEEPKQLAYWLALGFLAFWILRGCIPGLNKDSLPSELLEDIKRSQITCIKAEDTPVWPGEARQPECGRVNVDMAEEGVVPLPEQEAGVTRAICYRITVENPRWQTMGQTRHEVLWSARSYSKVAVLQNDEWQTFPHEDRLDEQRWLDFGCPGAYAPK